MSSENTLLLIATIILIGFAGCTYSRFQECRTLGQKSIDCVLEFK
jgi:hypothetical protein